MSYQPRWVRGKAVAAGDRDCDRRYELIRPVVAPYQRPATVWDLGANLGYFGCRLTDEFGAVSVMVDQRPMLAEVCRENGLPTTIAMTHRLTAADLRELAGSECPDVVLALNVLHHMPDWPEALAALVAFGATVIIETPGRDDQGSASYERSQEILSVIEALEPELLGWSPSHVTAGVQRPLFCLRLAKTAVSQGYAYIERVRPRGPHPVRAHQIASTFKEKTVTFDGEQPRQWAPGMNLWNWLQMGGVYPSRASVQVAMKQAAAGIVGTHGDLKPWNVVLGGEAVQIIDAGHRQSVDDAQGLSDTVAWIERPELAYAH